MIIKALRDQGCKKINFAGGEPFLPDYTSNTKKTTDLGEMVKFAKMECGFESVSIISNGRFITEAWMRQYHPYLDVLGVSCDSANDSTNKAIGRGNGQHVSYVRQAADLCRQFSVPFKLNTVVCSLNWEEDLSELLADTTPMRWKIFQVLGLEGENKGADTKRNVTPFLISDEQFRSFVERHQGKVADPSVMKVEDNDTMQSSYVLVAEYGRFLDSSTGAKLATRSILEVGVKVAWAELEASTGGGFDQEAFERRDGNFFDPADVATTRPGSGCTGCSMAESGGASEIADIEDLLG